MVSKKRAWVTAATALTVMGILGTLMLACPQAASTAPPARPTLIWNQPSNGGGGGGGGDKGFDPTRCASVYGTAINWGFQNEPGVTLKMGEAGWELTQVTADDGRYIFGALGEGYAILSVELTPEQAKTLKPMVDDVAVRLRCDLDTVLNVGLYSGSTRPDPPATITMAASRSSIYPGQSVTFYLTVYNGMPNPISRVIVTDMLPEGFTSSDGTTTRGSVEIVNGRLVTVPMGELEAGATENIEITATYSPASSRGGGRLAAPMLADGEVTNSATLFYAESAADQAWTTLYLGGGTPVAAATPTPAGEVVPDTGMTPTPGASPLPSDTPTTGATVEATLSATPSAAVSATPVQEPPTPLPTRDGEEGKESDERLPVTGVSLVLPFAGVGLLVLLVVVRVIRKSTRR